MPDALDLALANAASNMPKGEELHLENLDSIADPTSNESALTGDPFVDFAKGQTFTLGEARQKLFPRISTGQTQQPLPRPVLDYQQMMEAEYTEKAAANNATTSDIHHLSVLTQAISDKTNWIQQHLIDLTMQVSRIEATITTAAQTMSQKPSHNHRSLHEWDDTQLLNELVERENDLMPFYYELLKRIGSPELQSLVMSSMQGKNASMVTLAQLCSALAPQPIQPQYPHISEAQRAELKARSELDRIAQEQSQYVPTTIPQQQYFGQATEEYIRQTNNR